jgi:hypothetical protein
MVAGEGRIVNKSLRGVGDPSLKASLIRTLVRKMDRPPARNVTARAISRDAIPLNSATK